MMTDRDIQRVCDYLSEVGDNDSNIYDFVIINDRVRHIDTCSHGELYGYDEDEDY